MVSVVSIKSMISDLQNNIEKYTNELNAKNNELEKEILINKQHEAEIKEKHKRIDSLESTKDDQLQSIKLWISKIYELEKSSTECQKEAVLLNNKLQYYIESIGDLEQEAHIALEEAKHDERVNDEGSKHLHEKRELLGELEKKEEKFKKLIKELENECAFNNNKLSYMKTVENKDNERLDLLRNKLRELSDQLVSANRRLLKAEQESEELASELACLEEEADDLYAKADSVQNQLDIVKQSANED